MKFLRFKDKKNIIKYGIIRDNKIFELNESFLISITENSIVHSLSMVKILPPVVPSKIVALGYNYKDLVGKRDEYEEPIIFLKPPSSVISHKDIIEIKSCMQKVWTEVELCIVIGKKAANVNIEDAREYIFGFTIGNDVTTLNILKRDHHLARSKSWNTFCPIGPWIEDDISTKNLTLKNKINGKIFQDSNTNKRILNDYEIVSYLSKMMTLMPGDIIMTGTPANAENSIIENNDKVELSIEHLGTLSNTVKLVS